MNKDEIFIICEMWYWPNVCDWGVELKFCYFKPNPNPNSDHNRNISQILKHFTSWFILELEKLYCTKIEKAKLGYLL